MAQAALRHILLGLAATGLLMGCVAGTGDSDGPAPTVTTTKAVGKGQEVEAPEVFQTTDSALWDGRPSLGGIWVASAQAVDPERVVMFNPATGKSVTGALFRRERDNPGPALQLSSDAAEALGLLAGQPAEIRVTALRKVEAEAPTAPVADVAALAEAEAEPPAEAEAATAATAAAALAAADAAGDAGAVVAGDPAAADTTVEQPPKRKTWKERRAEAKAAREAKKAAAAAATADTAGVEAPEADVSTDGIGVAAIETAPLDARAAEAATVAADESAAPVEEPARPLTRREKRAAAEAAAAAQAAEPVAPEPQAPTGRPIQVASFSKEENATRAVEALAKVGVSAQTRKSEANGKVVWGVIALGDDAMLQSIKSAGFADAFFLK